MNPLPRFLALALFVVLAALVSLLGVSAWHGAHVLAPPIPPPASTTEASPSASRGESVPPMPRMLALSSRFSFGLAVIGLALALTLILSLGSRPGRTLDSRVPFATTRGELGTLARLAQTSVAQGEELNRERDVRRRAQEDAELQQQLLARSLEEKIRLGRDLHDGIIQSLYAVGLTLESVRALLQADPREADRRLEQSRARINDAIRDVRAYITGLAPEHLRQGGFAHAVDATLADLRASRDVQFDIKIDDAAAAQLSREQAVEALQIAREAVSNALRHGGASMVTVRVHQGDREICLLVQDNGIGFDPAARREGGHGLGNMTARAERMGATLRVTSGPGLGARVVATMPIHESTPT